jgi:hypothetical protein
MDRRAPFQLYSRVTARNPSGENGGRGLLAVSSFARRARSSLERGRDGDWLAFGSSQAPLQIWLTALGESLFLVPLSRSDVFEDRSERALHKPHSERRRGRA